MYLSSNPDAPQGHMFNAIGTSGPVTMVAGNYIQLQGDYHEHPPSGKHRLMFLPLSFQLSLAGNSVQSSATPPYQYYGQSKSPCNRCMKFDIDTFAESKIHEWMKAPDTSPSYNAARKKHQLGTGPGFWMDHSSASGRSGLDQRYGSMVSRPCE